MKVERMHNETLLTSPQAGQLIKSLKKTETVSAVDPDLPRGYQHSEEQPKQPGEEQDHEESKADHPVPLAKEGGALKSGVDLLA